jgi:hypothetical protein
MTIGAIGLLARRREMVGGNTRERLSPERAVLKLLTLRSRWIEAVTFDGRFSAIEKVIGAGCVSRYLNRDPNNERFGMFWMSHGRIGLEQSLASCAPARDWLTTEWLPKYAPELNDIERSWRDLKRHFLAHQTFADIDHLDRAVHKAIADMNHEQPITPVDQSANRCLEAAPPFDDAHDHFGYRGRLSVRATTSMREPSDPAAGVRSGVGQGPREIWWCIDWGAVRRSVRHQMLATAKSGWQGSATPPRCCHADGPNLPATTRRRRSGARAGAAINP